MHTPALYSFVLAGLLGTLAFQSPQLPPSVKSAQKENLLAPRLALEAMAKRSQESKAQYLKTNEELKQAWATQEPEARASLEKSGMKVEELQKQAQEGVTSLAREQGSKAAPDPKDAASATWTRVAQLTDQVTSRLTSTDPAWRARTNETVRRMVGNQIWFQPEITPVTTPLAVNPNTVVTHYAPIESREFDRRNDVFRTFGCGANYLNIGAQYDSASVTRDIRVPANARTVRVVLRDAWSHSFLRNVVTWGYGSAETKFTMSLSSLYGGEYISASQSMQRSVFVIAGYYQEFNETRPTIELTWTRPSHNTDDLFLVEFKVETWAGGGPLGSQGVADYQFQVRSFDVVTTS